MSLSSIVKGLIINGNDSVAVAKKNDAVYRLEPIAEITPIIIENFVAGQVKSVRFAKQLGHDYKVVGITVDFPIKSEDNLLDANGRATDIYSRTEIFMAGKTRGNENLFLDLFHYSPYTNPLFIDHEDVWKIKPNRDINKITLRCVPVIINKPITFS